MPNVSVRAFGSMARFLGRYVRDEHLMPLEEAIRKITSLPAQRERLTERGLLRAGYYADVTVFDPSTILDHATFEKPNALATGVDAVLVNGQVVEINWRAVRLRTRDNDLVVIPNGVLGKGIIHNFSQPTALHAERLEVSFSYGDPPNRVRRVLDEIALATEGVSQDPPPDVRTLRYGDFSTGTAIERVTEWEVNRKLAFVVLKDIPGLRELSPYRHVHAPHVHGYFTTRETSFELIPRAGGITEIVERTSHQLKLDPALYWLPFARHMVDTNNARVLRHIKAQAERSLVAGVTAQ